MASGTQIKADVDKLPLSEPISATPTANNSSGSSLNPITIESDDECGGNYVGGNTGRKVQKPTRKKRKLTSNSTPSLFFPTKGGILIPTTHSVDRSLTLPRKCAEITSSAVRGEAASDGKIASLEANILSLEGTVSSFKLENQTLKTQLDESKLDIISLKREVADFDKVRLKFLIEAREKDEDLSAEKSRLQETMDKLENRMNETTRLENELKCAQLQNDQAAGARDTLEKKLMAEKQTVQQKETELAEKRKEVKNAENQATLATTRLKKARDELLNITMKLATSQEDLNIAIGKLSKAQRECDLLPGLRFSLMTTDIDLSAAIEAFQKAMQRISELELQHQGQKKACAILRNQTTELERGKAELGAENDRLVAASNETNIRAENNAKYLRQTLDSMKINQEAIKADRDKLQQEAKEATNERAGLCRRIHTLEADAIAHMHEVGQMVAELAVSKQRMAALTNVESELQVAQEQIEAMGKHMEQCPMVQKSPEFWENWRRKVDEIARGLTKANGSPSRSPVQTDTTN
ncbi:hypothetical protein O1611_g800 [Lasiodiplodia mahajangana]|uniref:Uncharacterized protein n=1 Tax=Lasiodiplodia mahajangana TaxID=1108764 RepID=A0ACC2JZI9_9PEZI|nr:hypothetical protein O1611_g800 [Lasiodiplodia mahajangana]